MADAPGTSQRERELWPFVQKLRDWCEISGEIAPSVEPAEIRIGANTLVVQPWERKLIPDIEKAIMSSDLGLNPVTAGEVIRVPLHDERARIPD